MNPINIETSELVIEDITGRDFDSLKKIYNDKSIVRYLGKQEFSDDEISYRLKEIEHYRSLNLQIACKISLKNTSNFIGYIKVDLFTTTENQENFNNSNSPVKEIAPGAEYQCAYLLEQYQGKGYMGKVFDEIENVLVKKGVKYIFGCMHKENRNVIKFTKNRDCQILEKEPIDLYPLNIPLIITKLNNDCFFIKNISPIL